MSSYRNSLHANWSRPSKPILAMAFFFSIGSGSITIKIFFPKQWDFGNLTYNIKEHKKRYKHLNNMQLWLYFRLKNNCEPNAGYCTKNVFYGTWFFIFCCVLSMVSSNWDFFFPCYTAILCMTIEWKCRQKTCRMVRSN